MSEPTYADLAGMIDHALLAPTLTPAQVRAGVEMARAYEVASVCVMPSMLRETAGLLDGSTTRASTVIGFPLGVVHRDTKLAETDVALGEGAVELDMVVNLSRLIGGDLAYVRDEIAAICERTHADGAKLKVIFETCYLDEPQKVTLCEICGEVGVDWVKTSTGFGTGGATDEDLTLMREHSPEAVQVKASGGIRDYARLLRVRELGCSRAGASATEAILGEARERLGLPPIQSDAERQAGY